MGTLPERVQAFGQIATAMAASMAFPGYDSVQKVTAACWAADALAVHPVAYMSGVYAANMGGKLVMIPKVAFEDGLLRSRLPGYDYVVHEETENAVDIEFFAAGRKPQRVRYTMEQARRAGLDKKDTYKNYPDKMLFARCFHMGAHRIGPHILAGLPDPADYDATPMLPAADRERSAATVLDEAAAVPEAGSTPAAPAPAPVVDWHAELSKALRAIYGVRLKKAELLEKATLVRQQINAEKGLAAPAPYLKAQDFGSIEAQEMVEWLAAKYPGGKVKPEAAGRAAPAEAQAAAARDAAPAAQPARVYNDDGEGPIFDEDDHDGEEPPPMEDAPDPVAEAEALAADEDARVETIMALAMRARKNPDATISNRVFVKEAPLNTGTWWFTEASILKSRGHANSTLLQKQGEQRVSPEECRLLCRAMRETGVA